MTPVFLCINLLVGAFEQLEESYIVLAEETQVLYLIFQVGDTLDTHAECVTGILLAVDTAEFEYVGVYHAAT